MNRFPWDEFIQTHWSKQTGVFSPPEALAQSSEAFECLVEACESYRKGAPLAFKLFFDGRQVIHQLHECLPSRKDEDIYAYEERLKQRWGIGNFTLVVFNLADFAPAIAERAKDFLSGLFEFTGLPANHVDLEVFFGRYTATPGGIHAEGCSNFHWVIDGRKKMYTWEPQLIQAKDFAMNGSSDPTSHLKEAFVDTADVEPLRAKSRTLVGESGKLLYWPAGFWHVGESPELSLSINLAVYLKGSAKKFLNQAWDAVLGEVPLVDTPIDSFATLENSDVLPLSLRQAKQAIVDKLQSGELDRHLLEKWREHRLNGGFPARAI